MKTPSNAPKTVLHKIIITVGIVLSAILIISVVLLITQKPKDLQITNVNISTVKDGVYVGSAENGLVSATVSVEVSNGKILSITILKHDQLLGKKAEKITDDIIEQQTLEVDAVTSATYSSDTLRKAIENALRQGE